jgi:hypothetical protein
LNFVKGRQASALEQGISNGGVGHGDGKTEKFGSEEKGLWINHSLNFGMKAMKKSGNVVGLLCYMTLTE